MSGLFGAGQSNADSLPALGSLKVQTSMYGVTIPVVYGRAKISGNLGWYNNFKSTPITQSASGKGGGGSYVTGYNYSADVLMFLGEGPIPNVITVWRGKTKISGTSTAVNLAANESLTVPVSGRVLLACIDTDFRGIVSVTANLTSGFENYNIDLVQGVDYSFPAPALIPGPVRIDFTSRWFSQQVKIDYSQASGQSAQTSALTSAGLSLRQGVIGQMPISQIQSSYPAEALGYAGLAYVYGPTYSLGAQGAVENHQFEVSGNLEYSGGANFPDADPALVIKDILSGNRSGVDFRATLIDQTSLSRYSDYCVSHGLLISPVYASQKPARDCVQEILEATNSIACWVGETLKIIPRGDTAMTGNGRTFTPDNTIAFDITPDDFIHSKGPAVQIRRKNSVSRYNHLSAEWSNRAKDYNTETVAWDDDAAQDRDGINAEGVQQWAFFCNSSSAQAALALRGQRIQASRAEYEFTLWWRFLALEPGDLLRISDFVSGLDKVIVRVLSVDEDADDNIRVTAEDFPIGNASAPVFPPQLGSGFSPLQNADPGNVTSPVFFEPPGGQTTTGLEVWVAASGVSALWGGCDVYTSLDGSTYRYAGKIENGNRYGSLTAALGPGAGPALVFLSGKGGQLTGVTSTAASSQQSLCYCDGEDFSFEGATFTGANAYSLGGLHRGQNSTANGSHLTGSKFVFVDDSLGKSGPLDRSLVGKTIYFKLVSFNVFGGGRQSLGSVTAYPYLVTGAFMDQLGQPVTAANIGVGISGNLIANSDWRTNASGWQSVSGGPQTDSYTFKVEDFLANMFASPPRNYVIAQNGSNASQFGVLQSVPFSVSEGQRYGFAVDVLSSGSQTTIYLRWLDASGAYLSDAPTIQSGPDSVITPASPSTYRRVGGFGVAPAGAKQAAILLLKNGTSTGGSSLAWFARPTVALAGPLQVDLPQWDAGAAYGALASFNTVGTQKIDAGSTYEPSEALSSSTGSNSGALNFDVLYDIFSLTVTNPDPEPYTVILSGALQVTATGIADNPYIGMGILSSAETGLPANQPRAGVSVGIGASAGTTLQISRRFTLAASSTETYRIQIILLSQTNVSWEKPMLRAEKFKR